MLLSKLRQASGVEELTNAALYERLWVHLKRFHDILKNDIKVQPLLVNDRQAKGKRRDAHGEQLAKHCLMGKSSPARQDNSLYLVPEWAFPGVINPAELILQPQLVVNKCTAGLIASFIGRSEPNIVKSAQGISDLTIASDLVEHYLISWIRPNTRLNHMLIL